PSIWEGTSLAMLEAMASARPIVASTAFGNAALLEHGKSGYLVPASDPEALAEGLAFFLKDPEAGVRCGEEAYRTVKELYDIRRTIEVLEPLWTGEKP
ncbi:MAG: glycosyltransferase family 4 protein, partial [Acidobacteriota bacterium]